MARVKGGVNSHAKHKKILEAASGHRGARSRLFRRANTSVMKAGQYAYDSRRQKKRDARALWIQRINAAARQVGVTYSQLIGWLTAANMELDRRVLAELAIAKPADFAQIVETARRLSSQSA